MESFGLLISNITYARSTLAAFSIVWVVFLLYLLRLLQTRKNLHAQMELLKSMEI
ncbi:MAG: CcmD family protein [Methanosarcinales archaeon]|nr:CcmD family protein [Methanosarcinales archaeon]